MLCYLPQLSPQNRVGLTQLYSLYITRGFEEYLPCADSNLAATVALVATGVRPRPSNISLIPSLLVPGNEITLCYK